MGIIDRGAENMTRCGGKSRNRRFWVLDPVDGTKGFLRGQHFCIALALVDDGVPVLSVLSCPNMRTDVITSKQLQRGADDCGEPPDASSSVEHRIQTVDCTINDPLLLDQACLKPQPAEFSKWPFQIPEAVDSQKKRVIKVFPPKAGSIFYAVSGHGAYVMPLGDTGGRRGDAFRVTVQHSPTTHFPGDSITLGESAEAAFGNRKLSAAIHKHLQKQLSSPAHVPSIDFLRMDGQCKHCLVGSGVAAATLRLPPSGKQHKFMFFVGLY
jgi:3'-phosphoadenosine 5'-phosphosulfate (PAPS) 3'-phosphatase